MTDQAMEELYRIAECTNPDGTVDVELLDWEKDGNTVVIEFLPPTGERETTVMDWPTRDSDEFKFVRLCEACGLTLMGADQLPGSMVKARETASSYTLAVPETTDSVEKVTATMAGMKDWVGARSLPQSEEWGFWSMFALFPLFFFITLLVSTDSSHIRDEAVGYGLACWHVFLWGLIIAGGVMFLL